MAEHLIPDTIRHSLLQPNAVRIGARQAGGLSGASVWQGESLHGRVALRCWPTAHPSRERLAQIHAAMIAARELGQACVPKLLRNWMGETFATEVNPNGEQRLWELTQWMPGTADYLQSPSETRLRSAVERLACLHVAWRQVTAVPPTVSPTVLDRCQKLQQWIERLPELTRWRMVHGTLSPQMQELTTESVRQLAERGAELLVALRGLQAIPVTLHFVLRDIWSDHILFTEDQVTGIIDYGAARVDEPATDVARLLGSLEPFHRELWQRGWEFYEKLNPHVDGARVQVLDRVASLLSALQWLEWLVVEPRRFDARPAELIARWGRLVARLKSQSSAGRIGE